MTTFEDARTCVEAYMAAAESVGHSAAAYRDENGDTRVLRFSDLRAVLAAASADARSDNTKPAELADDETKRLIYEVNMMLSSVASHGPAALTVTHDPKYTPKLLGRLRDALARRPRPATVQHAWRVEGDSLVAFCGDPGATPVDWPADATADDTRAIPVCTLCHSRAMKAAREEERQGRGTVTGAQVDAALDSWYAEALKGAHDQLRDDVRARARERMRAALEATRAA